MLFAMKDVSLQARLLSALQRDTCWLCGEGINPIAKRSTRATVDHVIPLSKGGNNSIWNLAAAHYRCNIERKNNPPPAEAWPRLDALHLAMQNVGIWMHEDAPSRTLAQQRCYRLQHGAVISDIRIARNTLSALKTGLSREMGTEE